MLDGWVDKGVAPPPTHSDVTDLGDADRDGKNEHPAIDFPEAACPLGVYYPPTMVATGINFAAFSGIGLEPLDRSRTFVDMNRNGVWDRREAPTQAWRRLGLLRDSEELTRDKDMACRKAAALPSRPMALSPPKPRPRRSSADRRKRRPQRTTDSASLVLKSRSAAGCRRAGWGTSHLQRGTWPRHVL